MAQRQRESIFQAHRAEDMREVDPGQVIKFRGHMATFVGVQDPDTVILEDQWGEARPVPAEIAGLIIATQF